MKEIIDIKNHGFIEDEITPDQYVLGGYTKIVGVKQMPGGHGWGKYLPLDEMQKKNGVETMNCSNYGTYNALEILMFKTFGVRFDFSERYSGVLTGTTSTGNSPHKVIELIRNDIGAIDEVLLPFGPDIDTWEKYYSPNPMDPAFLKKGVEFLKKYKIKHDWVFIGGSIKQKQEAIKDGLEYSPLGISVVAWKMRENGLYFKDEGESDNHWCVLYDFLEGEYWMILDTYDNTLKKLEWDYDFRFGKRYHVESNMVVKKNFIQTVISKFLRLFTNKK